MGCNNSKEDVVTDNQAPTNAPAPSAQAPLDENHFASEIGFVIKTKKPGDQKVFINVFHHSCVLYVVTAEKPKFSTDRSGDPCLTYDCVISSAVQTMCSTNDEVKSYVRRYVHLSFTTLHYSYPLFLFLGE